MQCCFLYEYSDSDSLCWRGLRLSILISQGMYVDEAGAVKKLRSFAGKTLSKDKIFYEAMAAPGAWSRALKLTFVRTVAAEKVVEALTRLDGVDEIALDSLSSILLGAIGSNISSGDSIVLGWDGANRLTVSVRGKDVGQVTNADLPTALYQVSNNLAASCTEYTGT
jgi:hypothetical protein